MITLFHAPGSCSLAVKAALTISQLDYKTKVVNLSEGEQLTSDYKKINPLSNVPVIQVNGETISEGSAILQYISELAPNANLLPELHGSIERANALKWLMFLYTNVHPHFSRLFSPERYGNDQIDIKDKAEIALQPLFEVINDQLRSTKFITGESLSLADLYLLVVIHWEGVLKTPLTQRYIYLANYKQQMLEIPVLGKLYESEFSY